MKRNLNVALSACLILVGFSVLFSQTKSIGDTGELSPREGIDLVRAINTAEVEFFLKSYHKYMPLEEVLRHRIFQRGGMAISGGGMTMTLTSPLAIPVIKDATSGTVKNYKVSVVASADGQHYQVAVAPANPGCELLVFSDESGVIDTGRAISCPQQ